MADPRGAGRAGGVLFVAVLLFLAWLALGALAGLVRILVVALLAAAAIALAVNVARRR